MIVDSRHQDRDKLYQFGITKLGKTSRENIKILENHLFHLKMNEDYVINSYKEVEELVQFLNGNG
ncbi:hypothetical protein QUH73_11815 [Labilibaculum sp. K2S]|uniref:hypothetical protein n=1 Tax=Labilibaculum sp. K2S TaxID=3056386 RepID=UPI0025A3FDE2|nr:hypothetical protein [Labilibaculum sp. K2S]MDM8160503.1 hypothetical protein [Labilibaculum sp. K2S]